jgi:hypothetical protein
MEDVDFYLQMEQAGFENHHFAGMKYLHRSRNSSLRGLLDAGHDPQKLFTARRDFLVAKWKGHPLATSIFAQKLPEGYANK